MTSGPLNSLRRRPLRRSVALLAAVALLLAGFAQAAHYHKDQPARGVQTHLQCLLCLHADRWAGPPVPALARTPGLAASTLVAPLSTAHPDRTHVVLYDARGPPRI